MYFNVPFIFPGEKPFPCDVCEGKSFRQRVHLLKHCTSYAHREKAGELNGEELEKKKKKKVPVERLFPCEVCEGKSFRQDSHLKKHCLSLTHINKVRELNGEELEKEKRGRKRKK